MCNPRVCEHDEGQLSQHFDNSQQYNIETGDRWVSNSYSLNDSKRSRSVVVATSPVHVGQHIYVHLGVAQVRYVDESEPIVAAENFHGSLYSHDTMQLAEFASLDCCLVCA